MKQFMDVVRASLRPMSALIAVVILLAACKKNDAEYIRTPAAGLMAVNLAPDRSAVGFALSGNQLGNILNYSNYTGGYLPIFTGSREVRSFDYSNGSTIAISNGNFADSMYYSVFLLGANGAYRNLVVKDELGSLAKAPGKAWVRYINAVPDSTGAPAVTIGESFLTQTAPYATVSAFKQVSSGSVVAGITNGTSISASRSISLEENKVYTVLFMGLPGQSDTTRAVQVRFIQNGTVTH